MPTHLRKSVGAVEPSGKQRLGRLALWVGLCVALVFGLAGGAWSMGWLGRAEDPRVTELKQMQRDLALAPPAPAAALPAPPA